MGPQIHVCAYYVRCTWKCIMVVWWFQDSREFVVIRLSSGADYGVAESCLIYKAR